MSKNKKYQRPRGTYDLFGERLDFFLKIEKVCREMAEAYGFQEIRIPSFEEKDLFTEGVGEGTDVVEKEMYTLKEGKTTLALRPEGTAGIARAYIENGMKSWTKPVKLWYLGRFFRHERPQAGRWREFRQFGIEVLGRKNSVVDPFVIYFFYNLLKELGFSDLKIYVNSIGCSRCRERYSEDLKEFFEERKKDLCKDCKRRLDKNVMRILDCKKKKCQDIAREAPQVLDSLWKKCRVHFREVLEFLDELEVPYELDPFLVRGLDYYTRTVFEITSKEDKSTALVGGGRYDQLLKNFGSNKVPACGGAMGMERIADLMKKRKIKPYEHEKPQVFLAQVGITAKRKALSLFEELRSKGILVYEDFSRDALSSQLSRAEELGTRYTLILGKKELAEGEIIIRDMKEGKQEKVKLDKVVKEIKKRL